MSVAAEHSPRLGGAACALYGDAGIYPRRDGPIATGFNVSQHVVAWIQATSHRGKRKRPEACGSFRPCMSRQESNDGLKPAWILEFRFFDLKSTVKSTVIFQSVSIRALSACSSCVADCRCFLATPPAPFFVRYVFLRSRYGQSVHATTSCPAGTGVDALIALWHALVLRPPSA